MTDHGAGRRCGAYSCFDRDVAGQLGQRLERFDVGRALDLGAHAREHLFGRKRLGDEVVGAGFEARTASSGRCRRGQHDDRDVRRGRVAADAADDGRPVITLASRRRATTTSGRPRRACASAPSRRWRDHVEAADLEIGPDDRAQQRVVVDDQDRP